MKSLGTFKDYKKIQTSYTKIIKITKPYLSDSANVPNNIGLLDFSTSMLLVSDCVQNLNVLSCTPERKLV